MNIHSTKKGGFTIIEALIAISVLLVAIAGPMTIAARSLSVSIASRQQVIATHLAQEGVEYVHNKKDTNILQDKDWMDGLSQCISQSGCTIDIPAGGVVAACPQSGCGAIKTDETSGLYGYGPSYDLSPFTRIIIIEQIATDEVAISSRVSWSSGARNKEVTIQEHLFNWN